METYVLRVCSEICSFSLSPCHVKRTLTSTAQQERSCSHAPAATLAAMGRSTQVPRDPGYELSLGDKFHSFLSFRGQLC
jgi:hypothetical protein